jgi:coenzyme Q-binding protein COQ10
MPRHEEIKLVPYTAEQMFAVVADIERYPEFLPWCAALCVKSRAREGDADIAIAEMTIAYHGISERYTSRVEADAKEGTVKATHVEGPFKTLDTRWRFVPRDTGCEIHFCIEFAFKSMLLSAVAGLAFGLVVSRMTEAFIARAGALYGSQKAQQVV